jgi:hypothetical protein
MGAPQRNGRGAGVAGESHHTAAGLEGEVEGGQVAVGAGAAEGGDAAGDEPRVAGGEGGVVAAEALGDAVAEVFEHDVALRGEVEEHRAPVGVREVEGHRAFVAVDGEEVHALAAAEVRAHRTNVVAHAGALDLDHLGPEVAQDHRAEGPGQHAGEVEHADAAEHVEHGVGAGGYRSVPRRGGSCCGAVSRVASRVWRVMTTRCGG